MNNVENTVSKLLNLKFICVDEDPSFRSRFANIPSDNVKRYLESLINELDFVSLDTGKHFRKFSSTHDYDSFHLCAHTLMVDKIINYLYFDRNFNLMPLLEQTLLCSPESKVLADEVLSIQENRIKNRYTLRMQELYRTTK